MSEENRKKKSSTDVLIDGKIYSITGADEVYMQRVAAFINDTIKAVRKLPSYRHLDAEYKQLLLNLNIADEYFKECEETERYRQEAEELERELYSVKHDIVGTKMKLESALKQQEILENRCEELKKKYEELEELVK